MDQADLEWLVLAYSLPAEPSRLRVSIWRRLRRLGAIYLNEGFWVLPNTPPMTQEVARVVKEIEGFKGMASVFVSRDFDESQRERLRSRLLEARNEEYSELRGQYGRFLAHVDHARKTKRFTFAEVEELEEELAKLERWLSEIRARDAFGSTQFAEATQALAEGRAVLQKFTEEAFANSPDSPAGLTPD
jgi:DNA-binding transcriptional regulator PaaX